MYPVVAGDPSSTADLESTDSGGIPYGLQVRGAGTDISVPALVIPIFVVFLFLSVISALFSPIRHSKLIVYT